eukprot:m.25973 g.25973  ORF g.25973 m.25973 type:complete len:374 (+) comp7755_c0_seq1:2-1123(+)
MKMARLCLSLLLLSLFCSAFTNAAHCGDETAKNVLPQGDFENHDDTVNETVPYLYSQPKGWTRRGGSVVILNGPTAWGNRDSGKGTFYAGLQGRGSEISTTINLEKGKTYSLSFLACERGGTNEIFSVYVNGEAVVKQLNPFLKFTMYYTTFRGPDSGVANIRIINQSPAGDRTVFLDDIRILPVVDCGEGATCHEAENRDGYVCKCDEPFYSGLDANDKKASCTHDDDPSVEDRLALLEKQIKSLQTESGSFETRVGTLETQAENLFDNLVTSKNTTDSLKEAIDDVQADLTGFKSKIQDLLRGVSVGFSDAPSTSSSSFEAEIKADGKDLHLLSASTGSVFVDGEKLLGEKQMQTVLKKAIEDAFRGIADF